MHKKYSFRNKRIDNWLLKLQDLLPQILAIKYRKGIDNIGPDFLTRYEPLDSSPSSGRSTPLPPRSCYPASFSSDVDWSAGTENWDPIFISPVVTRSKPCHIALTPTSLPLPTNIDDLTNDDDDILMLLIILIAPLTPLRPLFFVH